MTINELFNDYSDVLHSEATVTHIFVGERNSRGTVVGFHHEGDLAVGTSTVDEATRSEKDGQGVYEANVTIHGIPKILGSSFFPQECSPQRVLDMVKEGYNNKINVKDRLYEANLSNGILVHFYQSDSSTGKIITVFPKYRP